MSKKFAVHLVILTVHGVIFQGASKAGTPLAVSSGIDFQSGQSAETVGASCMGARRRVTAPRVVL